MRTSSISSKGYSYAKTNPLPTPNPTPSTNSTSSGHYSHLRSRSGPPVTPQLPSLSTQVMQQQKQQQQRPTTTTRLDSNSESLVVVQRQASTSACGVGKGYQQCGSMVDGDESAPTFAVKERPDSLSVVIDDLAKITQELEDTAFIPGTHT